jgi:hypothetical protein
VTTHCPIKKFTQPFAAAQPCWRAGTHRGFEQGSAGPVSLKITEFRL